MTDTAEIIIREFSEWIKDELSEFESDCERGWKRMENRPNKSDEFYVEGAGEFHNDLQTSRKAFASRFIAALTEAGMTIVPVEPTEAMLDKGEYINSEWLNDNAPLGQITYRKPAEAVYKAMIGAGK